jgi:actin-related protein
VLALYATGRTTGIVLDSGEGATHSVPVFEGYAMPHSIMKCDVAGKDLTLFLWKLLKEAGYSFSLIQEREIIRDIKEKTCRISSDFEKEFKDFGETMTKDVSYELPDKNVIKIGAPQILCSEALFQPSKLSKTSQGVHEIIHQSVTMSDGDLRKDFYANVVLAGGTTLFPNLAERLNAELLVLSRAARIKVISPAERGFTTWIGGSILSSLSTFQSMRITKQEYEEHQEKIVHKKCF